MATTKGFIKLGQDRILPITRAELVLDANGNVALTSEQFAAGGKNAFGLISAAERALLKTDASGGSNGLSIYDLSSRLSYINNGLQVKGQTVKFYNETTGNHTPINVTASEGISVGVADNVISFKLEELQEISVANSVVRGISVDKYGRVVSVTGSALENSDLPDTISGKKLEGCYTSDTPTGETAIVNKKYVDQLFADVTGIASGGLQFKGVLTSWETAQGYLSEAYINSYFKVTQGFKIDSSYLYEESGTSGDVQLKAGDTLIVYKGSESSPKFVLIPSADDKTLITVKGESNGSASTPINGRDGNINLSFSSVFDVTGSGTSATITLPQATANSDGYLSKNDYNTFKGYAENLAVSYTGRFTEGTGVYEVGTLKIGNSEKIIYAKDSTYSLELISGTGENTAYNPILRWSTNGEVAADFTFKGNSGIAVRKNGNAVEFDLNAQVNTGSETYLEVVEGHKIGVKLGSVDNTGKVTDGLVSFNALNNFANQVHQVFVRYDVIENKLTDTTQSMSYGSADLIAAIAFDTDI